MVGLTRFTARGKNLHNAGKRMLPKLHTNFNIGSKTAKLTYKLSNNRHMEEFEPSYNTAFNIFPFRTDFNQHFSVQGQPNQQFGCQFKEAYKFHLCVCVCVCFKGKIKF